MAQLSQYLEGMSPFKKCVFSISCPVACKAPFGTIFFFCGFNLVLKYYICCSARKLLSGAPTGCFLFENKFTGGNGSAFAFQKNFRNYSYRVVKECIHRFIGIDGNLTYTSMRQVGTNAVYRVGWSSQDLEDKLHLNGWQF